MHWEGVFKLKTYVIQKAVIIKEQLCSSFKILNNDGYVLSI